MGGWTGIGRDRIRWEGEIEADNFILSNQTALIPRGLIAMWSGTIATIPSGWALCNGSNGTPDLRNRFIVCADADSGGAAKSTITGSAAQTGGNTSHSHAGETDPESQISGACSTGVAVEPAPTAHTHVFITDTKTHIPSFYALAYIMKL